jgi:tRNA threonylcarbamoyladenosine biosynthesis protein TsaB
VRWHTDRAGALYTLAAWNAVLQAEATSLRAVAGSALAAFGPRLAPCPAVAAVPEEFNRAGALLRLATWAHDDGEAVDAALALPVYLRDKVALTTAEREAAAGASGAAGAAGGAVGSPTRVPASARARVQEGR